MYYTPIVLRFNRHNDISGSAGSPSSNNAYVGDARRDTPLNEYAVDDDKRKPANKSKTPLYSYADVTPRAVINNNEGESSSSQCTKPAFGYDEITKIENSEGPVYSQPEKPTGGNKETSESHDDSAEGPIYFQIEKQDTNNNQTAATSREQTYDRLDRTDKSKTLPQSRDDGAYQHIQLKAIPVVGNEDYQHLNRNEAR